MKVAKVLIYSFLLLAVAGIIVFFAYFSNGFTDDFKTMYIKINDKNIVTTTNNFLKIPVAKETRFDVKYTFSGITQNSGYNVKIVPNVTEETSFDYKVGDQTYAFIGVEDMSKAFAIKKYDNYMTLSIPKDVRIKQVLQKIHNTTNITLPKDVEETRRYYYKLLISSYNSKIEYEFIFMICPEVEQIEISSGGIVL